MLPACGPLSTVAMPEICPLSLILLAEIMKRLESAGMRVFRSVITPSCQMKPWDQLKLESKLFPTTWPRLLMPVAKAGGIPRQNAEVCDCAVRAVLPNRGVEGCAVSTADLPGDLALVANGVAEIGTCTSEILKHEGSVVFPHYGVRRCGAGSRVAYGLASIVNPECDTVWIVSHQRKSFGVCLFPQRRQRNPIVGCAGWACGVHGTVFGISDDFFAVIDSAGLPVISAERRKSAHVAVSPKKRNARKVCAEAANVFAVRIWFSCFGLTNGFPEVVDPAPVNPTVAVGFSKRAQVDVESVDAYHRAAPCN